MSAGEPALVRSGEQIRRFSARLVEAIDMKAYGPPLLQHFAKHVPEATRHSLVQLTETSAITGHFRDKSGDAYTDIFSCKDFDAAVAVAAVREAFRPMHVSTLVLSRQTARPCHARHLAAR